jgi:hypothetical protein
MRLSLLVAAALLIAFAAFVALSPKPRELKFQSQEQQNRHVIERYRARAASFPVVYVGSSMAARLAADVSTRCVYDLALAGESALTGLHLLVDASVAPQAVFIETNVPERPANARLIAQSDGWLVHHWQLFATENKPVNLLLGYLFQLRRTPLPGVDARLQAIGLDVQRVSYARTIAPQILEKSLRDIEAYVRTLQQRGTQVVLFELPTHPSLEDTPRARQIRTAFRERFPDLGFVSADELARGAPIQTVDGVHLAPDESLHVAASLASRHADACAVERDGFARDPTETDRSKLTRPSRSAATR